MRKKCVIYTASTVKERGLNFYTKDTRWGYMLRNIRGDEKHPTRSLIFVIYDTPKVAIFGALTRYVYSDPSLYRQVGVAFLLRLNIWIQSGSTMWLCDELLTIVVLALVNRFVHGRVPSPVFCITISKCAIISLMGEIFRSAWKFLEFYTNLPVKNTMLVLYKISVFLRFLNFRTFNLF